ncbi:phytanoyl-CoA dioxygenase family protein [Pelagibacteraceae bacterium]|nr:phytanoyl-CoA dioxygenase family protein [Pelagibacteraceae bacterium]
MLNKEILSFTEIKFYKNNGYLVKKELISKKIINKINLKVKKLLNDKDKSKYFEFLKFSNKKYCVRLKDPHEVDQLFANILKDKKIIHILQKLLKGTVRFHHSKLNFKPPSQKGGIIDWHQDWAFYPHTNDDLITVGIYLEDCFEINGPLKVMPRSHKSKIYNHHESNFFVGKINVKKEKLDISKAQKLIGPAGSVTFHHVRTLHASSLNMAKHPRPLLLFGYSSVDAWPITYDKGSSVDPNINLKSYDKLILKGKPLIQPRLEKVPIRIPLPRKSDSIYQLQNKKK